MAVATAQPPACATLDLREVVYLFRNHLGKVLACVALALAIALIYLHHARPIFASSALLEVALTDRQNQPVSDVDSADTLKTVELKLASQSVLLAVIKEHHLEAELLAANDELPIGLQQIVTWGRSLFDRAPGERSASGTTGKASDAELVRRFRPRVSVDVVRGSRLIALRVEDADPSRAQTLAQAIIEEFFHQSRTSRQKETAASREQLLAEAKRVGEQFKLAEEKLQAYRTRYNAVSLQDRQNIVVERLRELNQQVAAAKNERLKWQAEAEQVKKAEGASADQLLGIRAIAELPGIIDLQKQVALKEANVATLAQRYGPLHPTLVQAKSELEEVRGSVRNALQKAAVRVEQSRNSAQATEEALQQALQKQELAALELDRIAIPYHALEREVQANGTMYQKILDDLQQHDVAHDLVSANDIEGIDIRVVESPLAPVRPAKPHQFLLLALSLATGLFAGCGLILGTRAIDTSIPSVDAAEADLGVSVFTSVPRSRHHRLTSRPLALRYPASPQAEAFRSLRTALSMLTTEEDRRCVLFTSAVPGEGKSFCALNCAAAFAQEGAKTLLIDADLRRPALRPLFPKTKGKPELSDCLSDPRLFPQALQTTGVDNLFCLGDSVHHPGSAELIGRDGLRTVIRLAMDGFDRVVIDTAPLVAVSDTLRIAPHVPTICLVVHAGKTPRRLARRALKVLAEVAHRSVSGLILNKINTRAAGAQYHYYYYNA
jgi:polysaccharide biosynthesis transport protein